MLDGAGECQKVHEVQKSTGWCMSVKVVQDKQLVQDGARDTEGYSRV